MALDGDGQWELVDEVHRGAGDDGPTAEVLQAEHYRRGQTVGGGGRRGQTMGSGEDCQALRVPLPWTPTTPPQLPVSWELCSGAWQETEASSHPGPSGSSGGMGLRLRDREAHSQDLYGSALGREA